MRTPAGCFFLDRPHNTPVFIFRQSYLGRRFTPDYRASRIQYRVTSNLKLNTQHSKLKILRINPPLNSLFRPAPAGLRSGNIIDAVDETWALRTNRIWSKGRVEYTFLAETFVFFAFSVVKIPPKQAPLP